MLGCYLCVVTGILAVSEAHVFYSQANIKCLSLGFFFQLQAERLIAPFCALQKDTAQFSPCKSGEKRSGKKLRVGDRLTNRSQGSSCQVFFRFPFG